MQTTKHFWAYGVAAGQVVFVRCSTPDVARDERNRMKLSDAKTVGSFSSVKVSEEHIRAYALSRGWAIEAIRDAAQ